MLCGKKWELLSFALSGVTGRLSGWWHKVLSKALIWMLSVQINITPRSRLEVLGEVWSQVEKCILCQSSYTVFLWTAKKLHFWIWSFPVLHYPFCSTQILLNPIMEILSSLENSKEKNFPFGTQHVTTLISSFEEINLHFSSTASNKASWILAPLLPFSILNGNCSPAIF